jgi:hypothetical protein
MPTGDQLTQPDSFETDAVPYHQRITCTPTNLFANLDRSDSQSSLNGLVSVGMKTQEGPGFPKRCSKIGLHMRLSEERRTRLLGSTNLHRKSGYAPALLSARAVQISEQIGFGKSDSQLSLRDCSRSFLVAYLFSASAVQISRSKKKLIWTRVISETRSDDDMRRSRHA